MPASPAGGGMPMAPLEYACLPPNEGLSSRRQETGSQSSGGTFDPTGAGCWIHYDYQLLEKSTTN